MKIFIVWFWIKLGQKLPYKNIGINLQILTNHAALHSNEEFPSTIT